jgi:hypothetical protein
MRTSPATPRESRSGRRGSPSDLGRTGACGLLTGAEIEASIGAAIVECSSRESERGGFVVSECFYRAERFERSVSLSVTRSVRDPEAGRQYWDRMFSSGGPGRPQPGRESAVFGTPISVPGVGEEAFWVGRGATGGLFVLERGTLVRVSVGGESVLADRIALARELAAKALGRLTAHL